MSQSPADFPEGADRFGDRDEEPTVEQPDAEADSNEETDQPEE
jgi:hypothetical protein